MTQRATIHPVREEPCLLPSRAGLGLKPLHFRDVLEARPALGWFEVHPENYMVEGGPLHAGLTRIRSDYPLSFHSVGTSLGAADGTDRQHILRLKALCERYQPAQVSDHLSWSRWQTTYLNDLLPLPFNEATLQQVCRNVEAAQELLGRELALENPSSYLLHPDSDMPEYTFLVEVCRRTGASILLDINNVYVSGSNLGWSPETYIERIPPAMVREIHLAGHKTEETPAGTFLIDDHGAVVCAGVWALFEAALRRLGPKPVLVEWDTNVPPLAVLLQEAGKAQTLIDAWRPAHLRDLCHA